MCKIIKFLNEKDKEKCYGIINHRGDFYTEQEIFDGLQTRNFTFYRPIALITDIKTAHKIAYNLNNKGV